MNLLKYEKKELLFKTWFLLMKKYKILDRLLFKILLKSR